MRHGWKNSGGTGVKDGGSPYAAALRKYERERAIRLRQSDEANWNREPAEHDGGRQPQSSPLRLSKMPAPLLPRLQRLEAEIEALTLADRVYRKDPTTSTRRRLDRLLAEGAAIRDERDWINHEKQDIAVIARSHRAPFSISHDSQLGTQLENRRAAYLKRANELKRLENRHARERAMLMEQVREQEGIWRGGAINSKALGFSSQHQNSRPEPSYPPYGNSRAVHLANQWDSASESTHSSNYGSSSVPRRGFVVNAANHEDTVVRNAIERRKKPYLGKRPISAVENAIERRKRPYLGKAIQSPTLEQEAIEMSGMYAHLTPMERAHLTRQLIRRRGQVVQPSLADAVDTLLDAYQSDPGRFYDMLLAGWGDTLSLGVTSKARERLYGSSYAQPDHPAYRLGAVTGMAHSAWLGKLAYGAPRIGAGGAASSKKAVSVLKSGEVQARTVARGYTTAATTAGIGASVYRIGKGDGEVQDLVVAIPLLGALANKKFGPAILELNSGEKPVMLGMLGQVTRTDVKKHGRHISALLDAQDGPIPEQLADKQFDIIISSNPFGFRPQLRVVLPLLKPGGKFILQGRYLDNPYFQDSLKEMRRYAKTTGLSIELWKGRIGGPLVQIWKKPINDVIERLPVSGDVKQRLKLKRDVVVGTPHYRSTSQGISKDYIAPPDTIIVITRPKGK